MSRSSGRNARGLGRARRRPSILAGVGGTLRLSWWDGARTRIRILYVGEDGILPNQPYRLDEIGNPVALL